MTTAAQTHSLSRFMIIGWAFYCIPCPLRPLTTANLILIVSSGLSYIRAVNLVPSTGRCMTGSLMPYLAPGPVQRLVVWEVGGLGAADSSMVFTLPLLPTMPMLYCVV